MQFRNTLYNLIGLGLPLLATSGGRYYMEGLIDIGEAMGSLDTVLAARGGG